MKTLAVAVFVTALATPALAQPGPGQGMRMRVIDELNLTEQQQEAVNEIHDKAMRDAIARRAQIANMRLDVRKLFAADQPDQAAIERKLGEISRLQAEAKTQRVKTWFAINTLLTPEQQKIWKTKVGMGRMDGMGRPGFRGRMHHDGFNRGFNGPGRARGNWD